MLWPIPENAWNRLTAAHLLNRAGFGAPPDEIDALSRMSPHEAVNKLVDFQSTPEQFDPPSWVQPGAELLPNRRAIRKLPEEERRTFQRERRRRERQNLLELRGWWLYRMRYSPRPLQEKLTLFWHGHFATSVDKVKSAYALYAQNETFRRHANGNWRDLVVAVSKDPAMLYYLDNAKSRKEAPNENYARELMELFTLGEGNYSEEDIREAARAFTGWTVHREKIQFVHRRRLHDDRLKTFMGHTGRFDGEDIIDIIMRQPAAAEFISAKLWTFFAYENPSDRLVKALARVLRENQYELKPLLATMFLSREFYSEPALRTQIKSPVQWLVGSSKILEAPLPNARLCHRGLRLLGQELFRPPNVKGWDGGAAWITTATLLHRYNLAGRLLRARVGKLEPMEPESAARPGQAAEENGGPRAGNGSAPWRFQSEAEQRTLVDLGTIIPPEVRTDKKTLRVSLQERLFQAPLRARDITAFRDYISALPELSDWTADHARDFVHMMMSTPPYQLC